MQLRLAQVGLRLVAIVYIHKKLIISTRDIIKSKFYLYIFEYQDELMRCPYYQYTFIYSTSLASLWVSFAIIPTAIPINSARVSLLRTTGSRRFSSWI